MPRIATDITNRKFGKLTAIRISDRNRGDHVWECLCDCGNVAYKRKSYLKRWRDHPEVSCLKCDPKSQRLKKKCRQYTAEKPTEYSTYRTWVQVKQRCTNPKATGYDPDNEVDPTWISSFENFKKDIGPRPPGNVLCRLDLTGPFNKDNCVWAKKSEIKQLRKLF